MAEVRIEVNDGLLAELGDWSPPVQVMIVGPAEAGYDLIARAVPESEVARLWAERDTLAAELDRDRHEYRPQFYGASGGPCSECGDQPDMRWHRTSRVVLAEHAEEPT